MVFVAGCEGSENGDQGHVYEKGVSDDIALMTFLQCSILAVDSSQFQYYLP